MSLNIGDQIPEFELYNHDKTKYSDKDFLGQKTKLFAPKFCTFWYPNRPVGTFIWPFPGLQLFWQNWGSWFNSSCMFFSRFFFYIEYVVAEM